ncbi:CusA/CzcA family heavy metal efflux RND transporter [Wenyingzhuangia sp. 2_MG-2023]|uniref:CusA/CzcA family heavy metal efflux RND transporter n=1 Tax=Wenyingzhuangia sp. 2_MG-2023 TaxID=3062639 RepID=UPI0026E27235|nr:CusA/CzcA family heavy metal efflux RND transporter [Wenyingzhuangia sp. 2_MG-2023]MDO6739123.1 CusA/CzcA family heavy metal efflux RND transporter [Wenyingzhuangia sp. 2_MG-2023]
MFDKIIAYSVQNKFVIGLFVAALTLWGVFSLRQLPIDAVPDITNNQVQIITVSPTLATQEVEQFITTPVELSLQNLQKVEEIRSISRFGLSVITVVFQENYDIYLARQLVTERIKEAQNNIPDGLGSPELAPISTGLGEIYQYVVRPKKGFENQYTASDLRTIQDWIVKRQLLGIEGVAEINSMGGFLKQYEVAINPTLLKAVGVSITDVFSALEKSNENTGGAYIEKNANAYYIRSEGLAKSLNDIGNIVVKKMGNTPILIKNVADVQYGKAPRYGALVRDGEEVVGGKVMMFKGANSSEVTELVKEKVVQIQKSLPKGVVIEPYLVRDKLVSTAIGTVEKNLIEGGLIVVFILVLFLGNWRAGLIVASVIPFAMLFTVSMMNLLGISANLMSLGAIDFGLIVDGAVIIVEAIVHRLHLKHSGKLLSQQEMDNEVIVSSQKIRSSAAFGEIIILMVYIPILALVGIEGKMFKPMAQTVMLAITGALILSLTYVPMMTALFLHKNITQKRTIADKIVAFFQRNYTPILHKALKHKQLFVGTTLFLFLISVFVFGKMGGEFIPTLEEGDLAMQHILPPGGSLTQSIETSKMIQKKLLKEFPEITDIVSNIGSAEIPTDPMPIEVADYVLVMKPKKEWTSASNRQDMFEKIETILKDIPGVGFEFSQPIQMRFNELMTGTKADIAIKLYGDDLDEMFLKASEAEKIIKQIAGVATVNVEQTVGMPQIMINYQYEKMAQYGLHVKDVNQIVRTAFAGEKAGVIYEGEKRFDLVVRLNQQNRVGIEDIQNLFVTLDNGTQIPLNNIATIDLVNAPMQISRENTNRRIVIGVNVGDTDVESLVGKIQSKLEDNIKLPAGYYFSYGGQFENLKAANQRLSVALPIALALIFILLYFTFGSLSQAALIFTAIPLSAIGGVWALQLRGMPFSISAGIGFIALFGVAVLNGIVLIGYFNQLKNEGMKDITERILTGTKVRLRPVLMTAAVASFGFLPMALSNSGGAEVQRPLATVVIGGLISATFLTLVILPIFYYWLENWNLKKSLRISKTKTLSILLLLGATVSSLGQEKSPLELHRAVEIAIENHPTIKAANLSLEKEQSLQNLKYNLGNTDFLYQGDGLVDRDFGQQVNQIGFIQNFPTLSITKSNNKLQDELTAKSRYAQQLTANELKWNVKQLYFEIQHQKELKKLFTNLSETYDHYYKIAKVRVTAGATNAIEELSLKAKRNEYSLLLKQVNIQLNHLNQKFQYTLNSKEPITTKTPLTAISYSKISDVNSTLFVQQSKQNIAIEQAKVNVIKSELKPNFSLGYASQNYYEGGRFNAVKAGVSIPLFNGQTKRKVEAQKMQIDIANYQYESEVLTLQQKLTEAESIILVYNEGMQFYKEQLQTINPEIVRIAKLNYQSGELSYLELLNTLELMASNHKNYWNQLAAYNKAVADYQFLTNQ